MFTKTEWIAVGNMVEAKADGHADICSCDPTSYCQGAIGRGYAEQCANARLISAAPEMLQALEKLLQQVEGACGSVIPEGSFYMGKKLAHKALAKARGDYLPYKAPTLDELQEDFAREV